MEKWLVSAKKADFQAWSEELKVSPVLARIIRNRDITEIEEARSFLYGTMKDCHSPWLLKDMDRAVAVVLDAKEKGERVRVIGDYDVDGICSAYILTRGFRILGLDADTAIPHRIHDGYGLNEHLIEQASEDRIQLIVTCDNGIAAAPQVALAKEKGIRVVITDHHEVPFTEENGVRTEKLPAADAVVDPKQSVCEYPFPGICGAVVAYKLIQALAERTGSRELLEEKQELVQFAAIATVCDVMELKGENRVIVKEGLRLLKHTGNLGLRALIEVNGLDYDKLSAYHLGFVIGPCLNATGRLDTALRALELLESTSRQSAMAAAAELKELNDSRKNLTQKGIESGIAYIEDKQLSEDRVLVVYLPQVHESLAGIIAGKLKEKYYRPVFVLTDGEEGIKGSGRSIETYHMYENMTAVKHWFRKFGGHKLAAGMTLEKQYPEPAENVVAFRAELNSRCSLTPEDLVPRVHIDVPMPISYATRELAEELELLEPFGTGNPKPLFAQKDLIFAHGRKMGAMQSFGRYRVYTPEGQEAELLYFGNIEDFAAFLDQKYGPGAGEALYTASCQYRVSVTYQLGINSFRGKETLQFVMQNYC